MKFYFAQRKVTREKAVKAYDKLLQSYMHYGKRRIQTLAEINKIHFEPVVDITFKQLLGINTPTIKLDLLEKNNYHPIVSKTHLLLLTIQLTVLKSWLKKSSH